MTIPSFVISIVPHRKSLSLNLYFSIKLLGNWNLQQTLIGWKLNIIDLSSNIFTIHLFNGISFSMSFIRLLVAKTFLHAFLAMLIIICGVNKFRSSSSFLII